MVDNVVYKGNSFVSGQGDYLADGRSWIELIISNIPQSLGLYTGETVTVTITREQVTEASAGQQMTNSTASELYTSIEADLEAIIFGNTGDLTAANVANVAYAKLVELRAAHMREVATLTGERDGMLQTIKDYRDACDFVGGSYKQAQDVFAVLVKIANGDKP